jgi:hypothetical protein
MPLTCHGTRYAQAPHKATANALATAGRRRHQCFFLPVPAPTAPPRLSPQYRCHPWGWKGDGWQAGYDSDPRIGNPTFKHGDPECEHPPLVQAMEAELRELPPTPGHSDSRNGD